MVLTCLRRWFGESFYGEGVQIVGGGLNLVSIVSGAKGLCASTPLGGMSEERLRL